VQVAGRGIKWTHYLVCSIKLVIHEAGDNAGFADTLVSEEDEFVFSQRSNLRHF
jgi:hypothetical protein